MLIEKELLRFCAKKTQEIAEWYDRECVLPSENGDPFPRSPHDLHHMMMGLHGREIHHRKLPFDQKAVPYRSFIIPYEDRFEIYYASGMTEPQIRFYQTKELFQIHLYQAGFETNDIVDLVDNMILRESPASHDLSLGHSATADTLGELAAMQFLFPLSERRAVLAMGKVRPKSTILAEKYGVPPFVIQRSFNVVPGLGDTFD